MASRIDDLLRMAMSFGASDLHLRAGSHPVIRVNGILKPLSGAAKLNQDETLEMAFSMMSNRQKQHFKEVYEVDVGYGVSGLGRFRVNIFQQRNTVGIVARVISDHIRNFEELGLPPVLEKIADENRGLILLTGTTGSGKSTTLAAIVDHINADRNCHIVTIEDPIEFLHKDKQSFVTQREVDVDRRAVDGDRDVRRRRGGRRREADVGAVVDDELDEIDAGEQPAGRAVRAQIGNAECRGDRRVRCHQRETAVVGVDERRHERLRCGGEPFARAQREEQE